MAAVTPIITPERCPCCQFADVEPFNFACEECWAEFKLAFIHWKHTVYCAFLGVKVGRRFFELVRVVAILPSPGRPTSLEERQVLESLAAVKFNPHQAGHHSAYARGLDKSALSVTAWNPITEFPNPEPRIDLTEAEGVVGRWLELVETDPAFLERVKKKGEHGEWVRMLVRAFELDEGGLRTRATKMFRTSMAIVGFDLHDGESWKATISASSFNLMRVRELISSK